MQNIRSHLGRRTRFITALAGGAALWALSAQAVQIQYELTSLGGNDYRYTYTVVNDGTLPSGAAVEWFTIGFDPALYDESKLIQQSGSGDYLAIVTPDPLHTQWEEAMLASIGALGIPVQYDVYGIGLGSSIPAGNSVAGFAVEFSWLSTGTPDGQPFSIFTQDANGDQVLLASGTTELKQSPGIPEPGVLSLIAMGLMGLGIRRGRKHQ